MWPQGPAMKQAYHISYYVLQSNLHCSVAADLAFVIVRCRVCPFPIITASRRLVVDDYRSAARRIVAVRPAGDERVVATHPAAVVVDGAATARGPRSVQSWQHGPVATELRRQIVQCRLCCRK
jgi:hypothetical protein